MNREIYFRGKHNNKWVYGYLLKDVNDNKFYISVSTDQFYQVKNNTIGQYTGLKDKNGIKVYEGDIVMFDYKWTKSNETGVVTWNKDNASFQIKGHIPSSSMKHLNQMKVIGNIYENEENK
jgi:uncharacterized phage protein (TIGR01671 family)